MPALSGMFNQNAPFSFSIRFTCAPSTPLVKAPSLAEWPDCTKKPYILDVEMPEAPPLDCPDKLKKSSTDQCSICADAQVNCIVLPCEHTPCCVNCLKRMQQSAATKKKCVQCQLTITSYHWDGGSYTFS